MTAPPLIPGYEHARVLGEGGCATVHLYRERTEQMQRDVAVKVLRDLGLEEVTRRLFTTEAQSMATLGGHPNIVQVFRVDKTPAGERYIVMQFYANGDLATAARGRRFAVAEALEIGVRIASAVETAHQAGILHRDIKPANVLVDEYGQPGLTDFGIAGRIATIGLDDSGLSVPWAAPEVVHGGDASTVTDVYSLAASVWQLLVGRSPFADPDGRDNSVESITHRVLTMPAPATGRGDVPPSLERLLSTGLAKSPAARPQSAATFANGLRAVQREIGLLETPLVVVERRSDATTVAPRPPTPPAGHTYLTARRDPQGSSRTAPPLFDDPGFAADLRVPTAVRAGPRPDPRPRPPVTPETALRPVPPTPIPEPAAAAARRLPIVLAGAAAVLLAVVVGVVIMWGGPTDEPTAPLVSATRDPGVQDAGVLGANVPPGVPTVKAERVDAATVRFSWAYSAQLDSDTFTWRTQDGAAGGAVNEPVVVVPAVAGASSCVQVKVVRADGSNAATDWSPAGCLG